MPAPPRFIPRFFRRRHSTQHSKSEPPTPSPDTSYADNPELESCLAFSSVALPSIIASPTSSDLDKSACDDRLESTGPALRLQSAATESRASTDSAVRLSLDQKLPSAQAKEVHVQDDDGGPLPVLTVEQPTPDGLGAHLVDGRSIDPSHPTAPEARIPSLDLTSPLPHTQPVDAESDPTRSSTEPTDELVPSHTTTSTANAEIKDTPIDDPENRRGSSVKSEATLSPTSAHPDYTVVEPQNNVEMPARRIWVKRPGASATMVQIQEGDLVDDVRDMILKKYANSLGRTFDAPDMTLRIVQRTDHGGPRSERLLGPEEDICRTLDAYYNGIQHVEEALIIDTPAKKTPRPSPHIFHAQNYHAVDDYRPLENGDDYFPPMPAVIPTTIPQTAGSHESRSSHHHLVTDQHGNPRSIAVLSSGQIPPLPSPGGTRRHRTHRPQYQRTHTSSPTIVTHPATSTANPPTLNPTHLAHRRPRLDSTASDHHANGAMAAPPIPTPPAPEAAPTNKSVSNPPTPSGGASSHAHRSARAKKNRRLTPDGKMMKSRHQQNDSLASNSNITSSMLDGSVPPINVLIVEDNIINLRILQGLMKRLKVRWDTAMNGQIAVDKWKTGGFHLVLMDIQMPIMNGLEATKAIRKLERENGIGVFSSSESPLMDGEGKPDASSTDANGTDKTEKLPMSEGFFKSPIIIVALTASSLQSDRHEALAAGCNDFLTKPVDFMWLQRKVKEWGCMQALIDFDGWRRWKDYANREEAAKTEEERAADREKEEKTRVKMERLAKLQETQKAQRQEDERRKKAGLEAGLPSPGPAAAAFSSSSKPPATSNNETAESSPAAADTDTDTARAPSPPPAIPVNGT